ncbi:MAG TPA: hypothetical protein VLJ11_13055 [Bryobacteraceae bacterium]|nr:hypothetical protein [Bryobacteraceae bacterium]
MKIISAASAFPGYCYNQDALRVALVRYRDGRIENPPLLQHVDAHDWVHDGYLNPSWSHWPGILFGADSSPATLYVRH